MQKNSNLNIPPLWRTGNVSKRSDSQLWQKGSDYSLQLDDKSKQRYKVKTNDMQGCNAYRIKKKKLLGNISKFPTVQ